MNPKDMPATDRRDKERIWRFFATLAVVAFGTNWPWEMAQMRSFQEMAERSIAETAIPCAFAGMGDVALTFAIYGAGAVVARDFRWAMEPKWMTIVAATIAGIVTAVVVEWILLASGRWTYSESMPIVPFLGVGIWPVLQLGLLVPFSFYVSAWVAAKHRLTPSRSGGAGRPT